VIYRDLYGIYMGYNGDYPLVIYGYIWLYGIIPWGLIGIYRGIILGLPGLVNIPKTNWKITIL